MDGKSQTQNQGGRRVAPHSPGAAFIKHIKQHSRYTPSHLESIVWKVFDIVDGAPAVPGAIGGDIFGCFPTPQLRLACLLARTAHASSFVTDFA
ncbi:hypothetical protein AVEN_1013-1 [Araneus ventricosus]|uniref:Uncharacterized protein n=1 Tax=Araneus ventricosus TaxID=182803 RepID=A0A4Y2M9J3_ARAVE|nr:hypothetical protein AVEN_1013-1 [Araneus ventricosus]